MEATKKFEGRAEVYTRSRPGYAPALLDALYREYGFGKATAIGDVGSGTGKFAVEMLERGSDVYCVEPNDDMRAVAERELGRYAGFHSVPGSAEHTNLKTGSMDYITVAQAFHWFHVDRFRGECLRVLKKGGQVILIWNDRVPQDPVNQELYGICKAWCPEFQGFSGGTRQDDEGIRRFFGGGYTCLNFDNPLFYDRDRFIARCLSSSYSLREGEQGYQMYIDALEALFHKYEKQGILSVENRTVAYIGHIR